MVRVSEVVWGWLGWCPMHAVPRYPVRGDDAIAGNPGRTGDEGPVARRSARFMRLTWGIVFLAWVVAFLALPSLPEVIPVHWNAFGNADAFANRIPGAFGMPGIMTLTMMLLMVLPRNDSMQVSLAPFRDIYAMVLFSLMLLLFCVELTALGIAMGLGIPIAVVMPVLIGVLFVVLGGLLPQIGRNRTMGIRLPWTIRDDVVWKKTHEHAGPLFMGAGALIILGSPVAGPWALALMTGVIVGLIVYISVWSYRLAKTIPAGK